MDCSSCWLTRKGEVITLRCTALLPKEFMTVFTGKELPKKVEPHARCIKRSAESA
jgi:hypothetical protein